MLHWWDFWYQAVVVVVWLCSGQTQDSLPPASYQHTPSGGRWSVCVSVQRSERGRWKGEGIVDVKIRVVKSLTPTASFSNLSCESVIHRCHYVIIVDFFVCLFFKVDFVYLNLVDLWIDVLIFVSFLSLCFFFFSLYILHKRKGTKCYEYPISWNDLNKGNAIFTCM